MAILYEIVDKEYLSEQDVCLVWLEITDETDIYQLDLSIPADEEPGLIAFIEANLDALWESAQRLGQMPDLHFTINYRRLLKAILLVMLDEINILREVAGLSPRTPAQIIPAIKNKLSQF
jgi:hypothetical protein